jgi:hypothetical protein
MNSSALIDAFAGPGHHSHIKCCCWMWLQRARFGVDDGQTGRRALILGCGSDIRCAVAATRVCRSVVSADTDDVALKRAAAELARVSPSFMVERLRLRQLWQLQVGQLMWCGPIYRTQPLACLVGRVLAVWRIPPPPHNK